MEEKVRLERDRIYPGGSGYPAVSLLPPAICGCLLPAFATLASGLTVALCSPLGTVSNLGQGSLSPQKRRLTKP